MKGRLGRREDLEAHRDPRPAVRKGLGPARVIEASAEATGNGGLAVRARRVHPTTTAGATAHTPDHGSGAQVHAAKGCPVRGKTLGRLATGAASSARGLTGPGPSDAARPNSAQRGLTRAHPAAGTSAQMVRSSFPPPTRRRPLGYRSRPSPAGGAPPDHSARAPLWFGGLEPWYFVDGPTSRCSRRASPATERHERLPDQLLCRWQHESRGHGRCSPVPSLRLMSMTRDSFRLFRIG